MVNEAVGAYLASQTVEVEAALEATLRRVREYRRADPKFESAMAEFAEAEVTLAGDDPAEGEAASPPGPAQRALRNLIRG
jgi:anti-sigma factor RsiW